MQLFVFIELGCQGTDLVLWRACAMVCAVNVPSVDMSTHGQDRVVSASCCVAFRSAYVQYASFKRLAGH